MLVFNRFSNLVESHNKGFSYTASVDPLEGNIQAMSDQDSWILRADIYCALNRFSNCSMQLTNKRNTCKSSVSLDSHEHAHMNTHTDPLMESRPNLHQKRNLTGLNRPPCLRHRRICDGNNAGSVKLLSSLAFQSRSAASMGVFLSSI